MEGFNAGSLMKKNQSRGLVLILLLHLTSLPGLAQLSIVGTWELEKDPEMVWVFTEDGGFYDEHRSLGPNKPPTNKNYAILNRSNSCKVNSTDPLDQKYLKIDYGGGDTMCYYLETVSEEHLVLIDAFTGRLLIFRRKE